LEATGIIFIVETTSCAAIVFPQDKDEVKESLVGKVRGFLVEAENSSMLK
jgi:hypothetical protein